MRVKFVDEVAVKVGEHTYWLAKVGVHPSLQAFVTIFGEGIGSHLARTQAGRQAGRTRRKLT